MSAKEQLINLMDFIGETEAQMILVFAKENFSLKRKTWDDIEEDDPTEDELAAIAEYRERKAAGLEK